MEPQGDVEVVQKVNVVRMVQQVLEAIASASTTYQQAVKVAELYHTLVGLRRLDSEFDAAWSGILGGRFIQVVSSRRARRVLRRTHVGAAKEALLELMDRHGMLFHASVPDPLHQDQAFVEQGMGEDSNPVDSFDPLPAEEE